MLVDENGKHQNKNHNVYPGVHELLRFYVATVFDAASADRSKDGNADGVSQRFIFPDDRQAEQLGCANVPGLAHQFHLAHRFFVNPEIHLFCIFPHIAPLSDIVLLSNSSICNYKGNVNTPIF